ncbi:helix-turn-helix domain-containing protein [Sediminispirochaeta bajacaliforniensis]|uniref:helix-turn-helix domain-containing protein n=1 Tax=Sediminispirochaeta bajacaliforniensis TaxID=148 RepID=UPI00035C7264|nr:helix-turn-helix domain-containing protein [Sediminispirochaeta bajacaliforniensis]
MGTELNNKLSSIKKEYLELPTSVERISFLKQTVVKLIQDNNEKWRSIRIEVKNGELNAESETLQLILEEENLAIGRVQIWLMDEVALAPKKESRNAEELSDTEPVKTNMVLASEAGKMPAAKKYMTSQDVADYLGISVHTIRRWALEQRIPVSTLNGKHNRFIKEEIDKWVLENGKKMLG